MAEVVSKLAAFVFENGAMAEEILFRDVDDEGEVPGVLAEERAAMAGALPHLKATWVGILSACREELLALAAGHPAGPVLGSRKCKPDKIWETDGFDLKLAPGAECGVRLVVYDDLGYQVIPWVWTQARHKNIVSHALESLAPKPEWDGEGSFYLQLDAPKEGQTYREVGARAAQALWTMARPVAEALEGLK